MTAAAPRRAIVSCARRVGAAVILAVTLLLAGNAPVSAHVVPWTTIQLDVLDGSIEATVDIPLDDVAAATGIDLGEETQADVDDHAGAITVYLLDHFAPTGDDGRAWAVTAGPLTVAPADDTSITGLYQQLTTTFILTPPTGGDGRSFDLGYDAVVEKVITHVVVVTVHSDWAAGDVDNAYELGAIELDTASGTVPPFSVELDEGSDLRGFWSMLVLGVHHIGAGVDHQLFLLTLLIPAPLIATRRRWSGPTTPQATVRRIAGITAAFTLGHSVTLALGALGLPVPQRPVEALIAVSIVVAAAHAIRPIFPGRETLVAGAFGLIHGLAFSQTLRDLDLSGSRMVLSLLGFNLGIELMQLLVVVVVLPPLILLARAGRYRGLRIGAAATAGLAALGWLAARLGRPNPVAGLADNLGSVSTELVTVLWLVAGSVFLTVRRHRHTAVNPSEVCPAEPVPGSAAPGQPAPTEPGGAHGSSPAGSPSEQCGQSFTPQRIGCRAGGRRSRRWLSSPR